MGAIVGSMFTILFSALAGGIWIGLTLGATGAVLLAIFRNIPLDKLLALSHALSIRSPHRPQSGS